LRKSPTSSFFLVSTEITGWWSAKAAATCAVPPKTAHYVHGAADGPCKFLIVQGVGVYDFVPVGG